MSGSSTGSIEVLSALREQRESALSGEALSSRLGVSRAQVWKHVSALRKRGYDIEGEPGGGPFWVAGDDGEVTVDLAIAPPLEAGTPWIDLAATGPSAQIQARLPLRWTWNP